MHVHKWIENSHCCTNNRNIVVIENAIAPYLRR